MPEQRTGERNDRAVLRAVTELRLGRTVIVQGNAALLALSAEAASPQGIDDLLRLTVDRHLVLPAGRTPFLASKLRLSSGIKAFRAPDEIFRPDCIGSLSIVEASSSGFKETPVPEGSIAAIKLSRLARLLPALIVGTPVARTTGILRVRAASIESFARPETGLQLRLVAEAAMPLAAAPSAKMLVFRSLVDTSEHIALVVGDLCAAGEPLVRVHSKCLTGDIFGSMRCDCGPQLAEATRLIGQSGTGALLYLDQEGRGIGLVNKLRAYCLQEKGFDTIDANVMLGFPPDDRNFEAAAAMLQMLGVRRMRLLTNNPAKFLALSSLGFDVTARIPLITPTTSHNADYLATKQSRFGHLLRG